MTTESTVSAQPEYDPRPWASTTLADQRAALAVMERMAATHPELPGAYIVLSYITPGVAEVQMDTFAALEAWRVALDVPSADVMQGHCAPVRHHLEFRTIVAGVPVRVYAIGERGEQVTA